MQISFVEENISMHCDNLQKCESVLFCNEDNVTFTKLYDTKGVLQMTNCHSNDVGILKRK